MRRLRWIALGALAACQADDRPRFVSEEDHFSIVELPGWTAARELGSVVFSNPADRITLAIRAVPLEQAWADARTPERAIAATARALAALPEVKLSGPTRIKVYDFTAARFDLSYAPAGQRGRRYERRHVVLVAPSRRIYHVLLAGPSDDLAALEAAMPSFEMVVNSLREEE